MSQLAELDRSGARTPARRADERRRRLLRSSRRANGRRGSERAGGVAASPGVAVGNVLPGAARATPRRRGRQRSEAGAAARSMRRSSRQRRSSRRCRRACGWRAPAARRRSSPRTASCSTIRICSTSPPRRWARQERGVRLAGRRSRARGSSGEPEERAARRARQRPARRRPPRAAEADRRRGRDASSIRRTRS